MREPILSQSMHRVKRCLEGGSFQTFTFGVRCSVVQGREALRTRTVMATPRTALSLLYVNWLQLLVRRCFTSLDTRTVHLLLPQYFHHKCLLFRKERPSCLIPTFPFSRSLLCADCKSYHVGNFFSVWRNRPAEGSYSPPSEDFSRRRPGQAFPQGPLGESLSAPHEATATHSTSCWRGESISGGS